MNISIKATTTIIAAISLAGSPLAAQDADRGDAPDAVALEALVNKYYGYLDRFDGNAMPMTDRLRDEANAVTDDKAMTRFTERALMLLADHHAATSNSFNDSWGLSSYSDIWVELVDGDYVISSVRANSPADQAGIVKGAKLVAISGKPTDAAVAAFWADLGVEEETNTDRNAFAARVLATGRRDRNRMMSIIQPDGDLRTVNLPNLYTVSQEERPLLTATVQDEVTQITINDALYKNELIAAFDEVMAEVPNDHRIVLDLTDTASGGNTTVARGIMGWFTDREQPYQIHSLPIEYRTFGVTRKWTELVLPREGKFHPGPVTVKVGRWTGSMGEGLAIGMSALGHKICGSQMAGLLGAIYTLDVPGTNQRINLPVERLEAVDGTPREDFIPEDC